jgi:chaperonin GroEL
MKIAKKVLFNTKARRKLLRGVNVLANAVGSTLGPKGRNVAVNQAYGAPNIWHDGVSVAKSINLKDYFADMGAEILKEAAIKTNDKAGDGTTTATILGQAIINEGFKNIEAGINPMTIKNDIDKALVKCVESLNKLTKKITTDKEIKQIATISSANEQIGELVAEAIKKTGKDGVITVEEGSSFETTIDYKQGMELNRGYLSNYFITNQEKMTAELDNPYILLTDKKMSHNFDIVPFMEKFLKHCSEKGEPTNILIIAGEVVEEALATLVINKMKGIVNVVAIQAPSFGMSRIDELEDLAVLTNGKVVLNDSGRDLKSVEIEELGRCQRIIISRDNTVIINEDKNQTSVVQRMFEIQEQIKAAPTDYEKDSKKQRLAKLAGGVAVIKVGANTETELRERKERVIDAVNATKAAIEDGVIAGGEIALLQVSQNGFWDLDGSVGAKILREALKAPFRKLVENAGYDYAEIWGKMSSVKYPFGIDVMDGEFKDMIKAGILDPVKVTRSALVNATSAATMMLTTACIITDDVID